MTITYTSLATVSNVRTIRAIRIDRMISETLATKQGPAHIAALIADTLATVGK